MILAVLLGMGLASTIGVPAWAKPGLRFTLRPLLRLAIVLLGFQLTAAQVAAVGLPGLSVVALALGATFLFTVALGRLLGLEPGLVRLIAAGTSICGASAVIAANTAVRASDEDVAYSVAVVTLFGTLAMVGLPLVAGLLDMDPRSYGLWVGASVHEVGQVAAAGFQRGAEAGEFATVAKLTRVMFLAPVVLGLGLAAAGPRGEGEARASRTPVPWFVLGFAGAVLVNSLAPLPPALAQGTAALTGFLLAMALAAVGAEASFAKLGAKGWRPFLLGLAAFLFIAATGLLLVLAFA